MKFKLRTFIMKSKQKGEATETTHSSAEAYIDAFELYHNGHKDYLDNLTC
jgi:hypothetical protein